MGKDEAPARTALQSAGQSGKDYRALSQEILRHVSSGVCRVDFLREISETLLDFSECDAVELRVGSGDQCFRCEATHRPTRAVILEATRCGRPDDNALLAGTRAGNWIDEVCRMIVEKRFPLLRRFSPVVAPSGPGT
jgi:hypothetical protein